MEFSLHKQLKEMYRRGGETEVRWGDYRIDAVHSNGLVEIQLGSLASIRQKIAALSAHHRLLVVKPLIAEKKLVKLACRGGKVVDVRMSPKRESPLSIVHELVYLRRVFPHKNVTIETPMVSVCETRYPGQGRRRRRRDDAYQIQDIALDRIGAYYRYRTARDLLGLVPDQLAWPWDSAQLAQALDEPRWVAQRLAYCLRHAGAIRELSRRGNTRVYHRCQRVRRRAA